ncbi:MAG: extracellular solute-binding protein [Lachnospiraceae bacterium]|nr:extracellular solute-binding protein [Lachnospiraceae bacterium]
MRCRGTTRLLAAVLAVTVFASSFVVSAEPESDATIDMVATSTDATSTDADTSGTEEYVNELLDKNYTIVSGQYTYPQYTGEDIIIPITEAWDRSTDGELVADTYANAYDEVLSISMGDVTTLKIDAPKDGVYTLYFKFLTSNPNSILNPELSLALNGERPFYEANRLIVENMWLQAEERVEYDKYGHEIVANAVKSMTWITKGITDAGYRHGDALQVQLTEGENTIELEMTEGDLWISEIILSQKGSLESYPEENATKVEVVTEEAIVIGAEFPTVRNDSSIRPTCEYDVNLTPYHTVKKKLNMLDGASYTDAGQMVTYEFEVEKSGYYYLGFKYRQNSKSDFPVFIDISFDEYAADGSLTTDGSAIKYDEMQNYPFDYTNKFEKMTMTDSNGKNMAFYLEAGKHTVTMVISDDNIRSALETADRVMSEINDLSLEITKIAGSNTDKYRDIEIAEYITDIDARLARWIKQLQDTYDSLAKYTDSKNSGALASLKTAITQLTDLAEEPNKIPYRISELSTGSSSVNQYIANFITDIGTDSISFDSLYVYQEAKQLPKNKNIFVTIWEAIKRFFASFTDQSYSVDNVEKTHLQVWVNRSRQYIEIIQQMIDKEFTPETGIEVDLCIMPDAQKLILSNAAGEAPDVALGVDYALPYDLAIRGALADLTKFEGWEETLGATAPGLLVPSTIYSEETDSLGIYSMPETFYFWVLYYRTDIMDKLGLEVPQTMEDVEAILPDLKNRGLDFYYPTAGTTGQRTLGMTSPLFYQYGGALYDDNGEAAINSTTSVEAFERMTELFTIYDIPQECTSFYQHFRNGDIPIGIADYFMYNMLINAAPEIENSWEISLVPGIVDEATGQINKNIAGGAQSDIIFESDEDKEVKIELTNGETMNREDAAWEFLSWWMSTDAQVEFGSTLQQTYGREFIWNTANLEAFNELPWDSVDKKVILEAAEWITETARIPGTYMLERELSNAYIAVVGAGENLRTSLDAAVKTIDRETERKMTEFGFIDEETGSWTYKVPTVDSVEDLLDAAKTE